MSAQVTEGIVVGFRKIEGTNNAGKLTVPIKSYHDCVKENDNLRVYLSARSLCASPNDEKENFEAASGSGLYVFYNNRFYLRGATSASSLNDKIDSVSAYGIFADIVEYCGWIQSGGINKYAQCLENGSYNFLLIVFRLAKILFRIFYNHSATDSANHYSADNHSADNHSIDYNFEMHHSTDHYHKRNYDSKTHKKYIVCRSILKS